MGKKVKYGHFCKKSKKVPPGIFPMVPEEMLLFLQEYKGETYPPTPFFITVRKMAETGTCIIGSYPYFKSYWHLNLFSHCTLKAFFFSIY